MADTLWLRAIQDFDYCDTKVTQGVCRGQGWLYQMLDLATDLSPHFRMPYATGPLVLSVLVSDISGASQLFDKAVAHFPQDWPILYRAAYHAIYEERNSLKAAQLLEKSGRAGAPSWVYDLSARLYTEVGKRDLARGLIQSLEKAGENPQLIQRMKERVGVGP